jgi:hypothetical protein
VSSAEAAAGAEAESAFCNILGIWRRAREVNKSAGRPAGSGAAAAAAANARTARARRARRAEEGDILGVGQVGGGERDRSDAGRSIADTEHEETDSKHVNRCVNSHLQNVFGDWPFYTGTRVNLSNPAGALVGRTSRPPGLGFGEGSSGCHQVQGFVSFCAKFQILPKITASVSLANWGTDNHARRPL